MPVPEKKPTLSRLSDFLPWRQLGNNGGDSDPRSPGLDTDTQLLSLETFEAPNSSINSINEVDLQRLRVELESRKPNWDKILAFVRKVIALGPVASNCCEILHEIANFRDTASRNPKLAKAGNLAIDALLAIGPAALPTLSRMVAGGYVDLDLSRHFKESFFRCNDGTLSYFEQAAVILIQHGSKSSGQGLQAIIDSDSTRLLPTLERLREHAKDSGRPYDLIQVSVRISELKRSRLDEDKHFKWALEHLLHRTGDPLDFARLEVAVSGIGQLTPKAKRHLVAHVAKLLETTHSGFTDKISANQPIMASRWRRDANFRRFAVMQNNDYSIRLQDILPVADIIALAMQHLWPIGHDLETKKLYSGHFRKFFQRYIWLRASTERDPTVILSRSGQKAARRLLSHKKLHTYARAGLFSLYLHLAERSEPGLQQNLLLDEAIQLSVYNECANDMARVARTVGMKETIGARLADMYIAGVVTSRHVANCFLGLGEHTVRSFFNQLQPLAGSREGLERGRHIMGTLRGVLLSVVGAEQLAAKYAEYEDRLASPLWS